MPVLPPGPQWRALRTVSTILKVFAWIVLVGGIISGLVAFASSSSSPYGSSAAVPAIFSSIMLIVGCLIGFVVLYAYSELIMLLIMIEHNTRVSAFK
jgi:hypothetical protein